jgi:FHS family Na+ dependent glucose MFS transporter 1
VKGKDGVPSAANLAEGRAADQGKMGQVASPRRTTIGYFGAFVAIGLSTAVLGPTLPGLAEQTASQLGEAGVLFTTHALGYLVGSFQGGRLYDRIAGHVVMPVMLLIMAVLLALVPLMPVLWLLALVVLLLGAAEGAVDVGGNTLLVWLHGRRVGPFMNGLHLFFGIGSFLAPVIVAQALSRTGDISWAYWALALLVLPAAAWLAPLASPGGQRDAAGEGEDATTAARSRARNHRRVLVVLIALFLLLYVGAEAGFGGWIYSYAVALNLAGEATAAYLTSGFWGAFTVGRLVGIPVAARFRPQAILFADLLGCLVSAGVLLVGSGSLAATWVGTLGLGFAMASIFPTVISLAGREIDLTGQITGWFLVGSSLGAMSLPGLMGQLFEVLGPGSIIVAMLIDLAVAVAVFAALMAYSRRQRVAVE